MCSFVTLSKINFTNKFYNFKKSHIGVSLKDTKGKKNPKIKEYNENYISRFRVFA